MRCDFLQHLGRQHAGEVRHDHEQRQLEGGAEHDQHQRDEGDVAVDRQQRRVPDAGRFDEHPQALGQHEVGQRHAGGEQHRGRGDEAQRVPALVLAQAGRDERPDLVEPQRAGEHRAGDHRDLQPGREAVEHAGVDELAVAGPLPREAVLRRDRAVRVPQERQDLRCRGTKPSDRPDGDDQHDDQISRRRSSRRWSRTDIRPSGSRAPSQPQPSSHCRISHGVSAADRGQRAAGPRQLARAVRSAGRRAPAARRGQCAAGRASNIS